MNFIFSIRPVRARRRRRVISITKYGIFVELTDLFVEGLIPLGERLAPDCNHRHSINNKQHNCNSMIGGRPAGLLFMASGSRLVACSTFRGIPDNFAVSAEKATILGSSADIFWDLSFPLRAYDNEVA